MVEETAASAESTACWGRRRGGSLLKDQGGPTPCANEFMSRVRKVVEVSWKESEPGIRQTWPGRLGATPPPRMPLM